MRGVHITWETSGACRLGEHNEEALNSLVAGSGDRSGSFCNYLRTIATDRGASWCFVLYVDKYEAKLTGTEARAGYKVEDPERTAERSGKNIE